MASKKALIKEQIKDEYVNYMEITTKINDLRLQYKNIKVIPFNVIQTMMEEIILYKIKHKITPYNGYDIIDNHDVGKIIMNMFSAMMIYDVNSTTDFYSTNSENKMKECTNSLDLIYKRNEAYNNILNTFIDLVKNKNDHNHSNLDDKITVNDNEMIYNRMKIPLDNRIRFLINKTNKYVVLRMLLRYIGYGINGQHCSIPTNMYRYFYEKLGVRGEGFGSPLNSKLIEMKDTIFCTLFKDTDKPFGSKGCFKASIILKNQNVNWTLNPPYFESIIEITYKKIMKVFKKATNPDLLIILMIPRWTNNIYYQKIKNNKYLINILELDVGKHYMNCNGNTVHMKGVVNSLFFLSKNKKIVTDKHISEITEVWNTYEEDKDNQSNFNTPIII